MSLVIAVVLILALGTVVQRSGWLRRHGAARGRARMPGVDDPPTVAVYENGVTAWLKGEPKYQIEWAQLERLNRGSCGWRCYSEAFWIVDGAGAQFVSPVDVIVGAEELQARFQALPGFDTDAYRAAMIA